MALKKVTDGNNEGEYDIHHEGKPKRISLLISIAVMLFGMASWIDYHIIFVELPIFVTKLPEKWALPSYISLTLVVAYIGPAIYLVVSKFAKGPSSRFKEMVGGYLIIVVDIVGSIFLIFFWDSTAHVFGAERSVALFLLIFIISMADTSSYVVFVPFMTRYPSGYMPAYFAGEQLGGLLAGLLGLVQGVSEEAICMNVSETIYNETTDTNMTMMSMVAVPSARSRFPASVFFVILVGMLLLSLAAYTFLNVSSLAGRTVALYSQMKNKAETASSLPDVNINKSSKWRLVILVLIYAYPDMVLYGTCISLMPYAALPYGGLAYTLSLRLASILCPLTCLATKIYSTRSLRILIPLNLIVSVLLAYIAYLAAVSPFVPLANHPAGAAIVIIAYLAVAVIQLFSRTCAGMAIHEEAGSSGLKVAGVVALAAFALATVLMFLLVNVFMLFHQEEPCLE